ncbi:MAG: hypothetical protein U0O30_04550 [Streptococcus sp.]|nr:MULTISPECIES: hypothetical protein [Streptococcus]MDU6443447.1 hypothetical protein [Streptococcus sp.]MDV5122141.1 hypothetical protein [Streptococcus pasteurianus]MDV5133819.1 hypothetical protein [Streptococcus pasteurianus]MDV5163593.1 hypothetical protein [Streptococcus pasteurianus]MDY5268578.1 hypothetical protein [Streptococcus sp.]
MAQCRWKQITDQSLSKTIDKWIGRVISMNCVSLMVLSTIQRF